MPPMPEGVGDRLAHAVPGRDVEVGAGGGVPADLDLVDDVVGAVDGGRAGRGGAVTVAPAPVCSLIRRASGSACASRSALDVVQRELAGWPCSSG